MLYLNHEIGSLNCNWMGPNVGNCSNRSRLLSTIHANGWLWFYRHEIAAFNAEIEKWRTEWLNYNCTQIYWLITILPHGAHRIYVHFYSRITFGSATTASQPTSERRVCMCFVLVNLDMRSVFFSSSFQSNTCSLSMFKDCFFFFTFQPHENMLISWSKHLEPSWWREKET